MAPKKKKKSKGKKKRTTSAKDDEERPKVIQDKPEYEHPLRSAPRATMSIQLAFPPTNLMTIDKWEAPTSTRLYMLQREIAKLYGGSVDDIRICVGTYAEDQAYTDPNLTLKDIGIATDGMYTVYYDFKVKSSPLLNSALTYKIYEEK